MSARDFAQAMSAAHRQLAWETKGQQAMSDDVKRPSRKCKNCLGHGEVSTDMLGSDFVTCDECNGTWKPKEGGR